MKYANGYILLAVLVFLQVFSFLGLYALSRVAEALKHNALFFQQHTHRIQGERQLLALEQRALTEVDTCRIPITSPVEIAFKQIDWWQANACYVTTDGVEQYYVIEWLDDDVCGLMGHREDGQLLIARYYRMTLLMLTHMIKDAKLLWQSTIAIPTDANGVCPNNQYHTVTKGRQMWREI